MKQKRVFVIITMVVIAVTVYPVAYSYLTSQSSSGPYLCAPLIPCQPPSAGVETCVTACLISIANATFTPGTLIVSPGATIVWMNHDGFSHTATPFNGTAWESRVIAPGASFTLKLGANVTPGVYYYTCLIHPAMIGELKIRASS